MQKSCEDCISRQAAIDAINEYGSVWMEYTETMSVDEIADRALKASKQSMHKILHDLPSVTPAERVGRWIPVSERLPEVMDGSNNECSDDVLICVADNEWITISTGFYGYYPRSKSQQGWWSMWAYGCHQLDSKYKVVAWMPLPEPYKASPTGLESEEA